MLKSAPNAPQSDDLTIGQAFSADHINRRFQALAIRKPARIPTEGKFVAISAQVFLADMVERTVNAALNQAEKRFNGVAVRNEAVILNAAYSPRE